MNLNPGVFPSVPLIAQVFKWDKKQQENLGGRGVECNYLKNFSPYIYYLGRSKCKYTSQLEPTIPYVTMSVRI
jgi:hypothetical protein